MIPKSVTIAPLIFTVEIVRGLLDKGEPLDGQIFYDEAKISLDDNLSARGALMVLLHECIHAIGETSGHDISEGLVSALTYGLTRFAQDNPTFWKALIQ